MEAKKKVGLVACVVLGLAALGSALQERDATMAGGLRIGVFDSRAIAVAYAASNQWEEKLQVLRTEHEQAQAEGDDERVDEIEAKAMARQARMHRQGFSTAPVDDILVEIADLLPGIADRAGVDVIVSKWRIVYERSTAELVDVTELMIQPFTPDEEVLETVREMADKAPLDLYETDWEAIEKSH